MNLKKILQFKILSIYQKIVGLYIYSNKNNSECGGYGIEFIGFIKKISEDYPIKIKKNINTNLKKEDLEYKRRVKKRRF